MRPSENWQDYKLLDASGGEKLERWGDIILIRPDPQIIWDSPKTNPLWKSAHARYLRSSSGGGSWEFYKKIPESWTVSYSGLGLKFKISPTGFKHTGLFPEQAANWEYLSKKIKSVPGGKIPAALNLFAYTGGASAACLAAGASVCHVDASRGMTAWAKENMTLSGLSGKPVRYIVDDCKKFAGKELRRGRRYDIIIMDPPSYGRGSGGEVWKLESAVYELVRLCAGLLSDKPVCFVLSSYTTGLSASVSKYILEYLIRKKMGGRVLADELGLPVEETGLYLPCGSAAVWEL
ncbi:MAG: class I SAM-dependent methyltransferase [Oscillospiraceae bacterium]|jgi:23S rRNA (cytosine1962-C5)-methyltransferase|nr:class I SAM-dependent methyltransferase [Oscillospiraceae bacterium]